jgi:hypothetical protein
MTDTESQRKGMKYASTSCHFMILTYKKGDYSLPTPGHDIKVFIVCHFTYIGEDKLQIHGSAASLDAPKKKVKENIRKVADYQRWAQQRDPAASARAE